MSCSSQRNRVIFYIDRNLGGRIVPEKLRKAGISVEVHDDHLPQDAPDEDWINLVGQNGWVALTKDRNIQHRMGEHMSIVKAKAKVIVLRAKDVTGDQCAEILLKHIEKIESYSDNHEPPFLVGIDRNGQIKAYKLNTNYY